MSLGYPPLRPKSDGLAVPKAPEGSHGMPDMMTDGYCGVKGQITQCHPLEYTEQQWSKNQEKMDMAMLRNLQGVHAPVRLHMERNTAKQMQRLPGMPSSNLMYDTLTGRLDNIDFEDILNVPDDAEIVGNTHAMMERKAGLL